MVSKRYDQLQDKIGSQTEKISAMLSPKNKRKTQGVDGKFEKSVNDFLRMQAPINFLFK